MCESMSAGGANSWLWFHYLLKFSNFITLVEDERQQLAHSLSISHFASDSISRTAGNQCESWSNMNYSVSNFDFN